MYVHSLNMALHVRITGETVSGDSRFDWSLRLLTERLGKETIVIY